MSKRRILTISFWASAFLFTAMSACFLLMPLIVNGVNSTRAGVIALGVSFWVCTLLGYCSVIIGSAVRKQICKKERIRINGRPGVISFISNIPALLFDAGLLVSIVLLVVTLLTSMRETYFAYVSIALTVFFLHMHALFNGKDYHIISRIQKRSGKYHGHFEK